MPVRGAKTLAIFVRLMVLLGIDECCCCQLSLVHRRGRRICTGLLVVVHDIQDGIALFVLHDRVAMIVRQCPMAIVEHEIHRISKAYADVWQDGEVRSSLEEEYHGIKYLTTVKPTMDGVAKMQKSSIYNRGERIRSSYS